MAFTTYQLLVLPKTHQLAALCNFEQVFAMKNAVLMSLFLAESVLAMPPAQRHAFPRQDVAQKYKLGHQFDNHWRDDCSRKQAEDETTGNGPEASNKPDNSTSTGQTETGTTGNDPEGPTSTGPGTNITEQDTEYSDLWVGKCLAPSLKA